MRVLSQITGCGEAPKGKGDRLGVRKECARVSWLPLLPGSFAGPSPPCLPSPLSPSWFPPPTPCLQDEAPRGSSGEQEDRGAEQGLGEGLGGQAPPATPTRLCSGIRGHFPQALEVKQRATGPLEVSPEVFTREEKKEYPLDGECGATDAGQGQKPALFLRALQGCGAWKDTV